MTEQCELCRGTGFIQVKAKTHSNGHTTEEVLDVPCGACPLGATKAANKHWKARQGSRHDQKRRIRDWRAIMAKAKGTDRRP